MEYNVLQFGNYVFDPGRGALLTTNGDEVRLRPKSYELLQLFLQHPGRLLDRLSINNALWKKVVVSDESISQCIKEVRKAIGDYTIIETVPKRGYRFTAKVATQAPKPARVLSSQPRRSPQPPLAPGPSVAVLPFKNLGYGDKRGYFVDGLVEEVTTALARGRWLSLIAPSSCFTYKRAVEENRVDLRQVGRELGVRYVLEGSVKKGSGSRLRVTTRLIQTASRALIGHPQNFDGAIGDIFALQDAVALGVAGRIEPALRNEEIQRIQRQEIADTAYDLYLDALGRIHFGGQSSAKEAIHLLERALDIEPSYVPAAGLICECHILAHSEDPLCAQDQSDAAEYARNVIRSANDYCDALWMASCALSVFSDRRNASRLADDQDMAKAGVSLALHLNPSSAGAWNGKGWIHCHRGDSRGAIECFERAIKLSPLDPWVQYFKGGLALAYLGLRQFKKALNLADETLRESREAHLPTLRVKVAAAGYLGLLDTAQEGWQLAVTKRPGLTVEAWVATSTFASDVKQIIREGLQRAKLE